MKRTLILLCMLALSGAALAKDVYVDGYTKRDGTYVEPHHRSSPNSSKHDNYNAQGNNNPYTGQKGYESNEYSNPPTYNKPKPYGR